MVMEVKLLQDQKQKSPKLVTEFGMVMEGKLMQRQYLQLAICQLVLIKTVEK